MNRLKKTSKSLVSSTSTNIKRYLFDEINWDNRLISITGARGAGKTTLLLQRIKEKHKSDTGALYVSLDDIYFETIRLVEFAEAFSESGGTHLYLDEVHKYQHWSKDLKLIYDYHPNLHIIFTGSSALNIYKGDSDLSRRAVSYQLVGLSFREFINFEYGLEMQTFSIDLILHSDILIDLLDKIDIAKAFQNYIEYGYYPFYLEGKEIYGKRLTNIVNLVLEIDIPNIENINFQTIHKIKRLLSILTGMVPFTPNISRLAQDMGISRDMLLKYISWLKKANIIHTLSSSSKGMGSLTKPDKIFLNNTNLSYALGRFSPDKGNLRETFFINQLSVNYQVNTPKYGDFIIDDSWVFEIGGPSKTDSQLRGVPQSYAAAADIRFKKGNKIPLWHFGFTY